MSVILLLSIVAACGEPPRPERPLLPGTSDTGTPPHRDPECNGYDDDGNGEIDEGWPDDDGNGRADCLDMECPPLDLGRPGARDVDASCETGANLGVAVTDVCVSDCTFGPVAVGLHVWNAGGAEVGAGVILSLYASDSPNRLVATYTLPAVPAGTALAGIEVELTPAEVGDYGFEASVDDDGTGVGTVEECVETDNAASWVDVFCP